ncbi:MAG TPA: hypothetical protein VIV40_00235, partial [Kofleriaceae bacterium]
MAIALPRVCTADRVVSPPVCEPHPADSAVRVALRLHECRFERTQAMSHEPSLSSFETVDDNTLADIHGGYRVSGEGMNADARWIMMHESGGRTHVK